MNFYLVFCKTRKKFDKYIKVNKIKDKVIIDIRKMADEERIDSNNINQKKYFNVIVYKKIMTAIEKKKDVYYIPNFENIDFDISKLVKMKDMMCVDDAYNLLVFHAEFDRIPSFINQAFNNIHHFDGCQILKDY